jgi:histidinol-phosphate aminotransferase
MATDASVLARATERARSIARYSPGKPARGVESGKLSSNEAPFGASPRARAAVASCTDMLHRYPAADQLLAAIAAHERCDVSEVVITAGSDEFCYLIAALLLDAGDTVVVGDPCYAIDALVTRLQGGRLLEVPLIDGLHDLDAMAQAAQSARLLWLPNPHNPTGRAVDVRDLERFLDAVPPRCLVVLDEAYRDFMDADVAPDTRALRAAHDNLVVQRTLSKSHALAGLRAGYALGPPALIAALDAIRPPFNLNLAAQVAAQAALADDAWRVFTVTMVVRERERLLRFCERRGLRHHPSQANFVTIRLGDDVEHVIEALADRGLAVRDGATLGIPGWIRVSIGPPPQMALLRRVLDEAVQPRRDA